MTMKLTNPYESPRHVDNELSRSDYASVGHRIMWVFAFAVIGYVAYVGSTLLYAMINPGIRLAEVKWAFGIIVSIALCSSEMFVINTWQLNKSVTRRMVLSSGIALISTLVAAIVANNLRLGESRIEGIRVLPRLLIFTTVFLLVAFSFRGILSDKSNKKLPCGKDKL